MNLVDDPKIWLEEATIGFFEVLFLDLNNIGEYV